MSTDWYFPPDHGGEENGLNDAGIEFFRSSGSLARETVQNSGDARDPDAQKPVRVSFTLLNLKREDFPGIGAFTDVVVRARDYVIGACDTEEERKANGEEFFKNALKLLEAPSIPVLRISDFNTTGLEGNEDGLMSPWYRLIRRQGTTSMHGAGGGTFGIGQRAPFAFSDLRTVFYGTRTKSGDSSLIGKSILCTFKDAEAQRRRAVGFWGQKNSGEAVTALRNAAVIPENFRRDHVGTDLYIAGFTRAGWMDEVSFSIIRNFFAALQAGQLEVELSGPGTPVRRIDASTVHAVIDESLAQTEASARPLAEKREVRAELEATRHYLSALTHPHGGAPVAGTLTRLGEVKLYLSLSDKAPSRVAFMRKPRILVFDRTQRAGLQGYAGVFICENDKGNWLLAKMEDPSHVKWERDRLKDGGSATLDEVNAFVRESLKKVAGLTQAGAQDIPDLGHYLPEDDSQRVGETGKGTQKTQKVTPKETGQKQQKAVRVLRNSKKRAKAVAKEDVPEPDLSGVDGPVGITGGQDSKTGEHGTNPGSRGDATRRREGKAISMRRLTDADVGFRSFYAGPRGQKLNLVVWSERSGEADIVLRAAGEAGKYPVTILSAEDAQSGALASCEGAALRRVALKAGERRRFLIRLEGDPHVALTVEVR
ncbi:hypothetical protein [Myxococcus landrumensis]|uniref:Uncharacterized protein n=1 Tax=Myxococcus landrumensis TaxID=2813577 RepID=A0ABX7N482_9BACT|nr:hypothetical protein [Myxococcus landrumus]QSQ11213.1 hypothetical protein JY572_22610 [Myxococcus landrumus]